MGMQTNKKRFDDEDDFDFRKEDKKRNKPHRGGKREYKDEDDV
jgi:hypothetical protein